MFCPLDPAIVLYTVLYQFLHLALCPIFHFCMFGFYVCLYVFLLHCMQV
jgi:hypothetical protein